MFLSRVIATGKPLLSCSFSWKTWQKIPKTWNVHLEKKEKALLNRPQLKPFPKFLINYNDTLDLPGLEGYDLFNMYVEFIERKDTPLSSQFIAMMLYNFSKNGYLNKVTWTKLEPYISRNRGQYSMRSIFGGLYACIRYGKPEHVKFFIEEMTGQKLSFTDLEALQIVEAFNLSKYPFTKEEKHTIWQTYFKQYFMESITRGLRVHNLKQAFRAWDAFDKFEYYQDEELWNTMIGWLERRKGWKRTEVIQRLYPLTGTFEKAKEVFDTYYEEMSAKEDITWRYNMEEVRYYTSEEMIAKSQENINMRPHDRTVVKRKDQKEKNEELYAWQKDGARQKEAELVKDKAQSLAYAIKNRYESMRKDNTDFSKLSLEEFEDLFGEYDPELMYKPPEVRPEDLEGELGEDGLAAEDGEQVQEEEA